MSASGAIAGTAEADAQGAFVVALEKDADGRNLRVLAKKGRETRKTIAPLAELDSTLDLGNLDARSTAIAQLALYEVMVEAGSTLSATPPPALAGLLAKAKSLPTAELTAFEMVVTEILSRAASGGDGIGPFELATSELSQAYLDSTGADPTLKDRYKSALAAAATGYGLEIRCDPSRLNAMFTVDVSGRGLDGN
jgi:hypothetical protein